MSMFHRVKSVSEYHTNPYWCNGRQLFLAILSEFGFLLIFTLVLFAFAIPNFVSYQAHFCTLIFSRWTVATLTIFGRLTWINQTDLTRFILASQDDQTGGIADKPGNIPDPFHTLFGLAGLSLLAQVDSYFSSPRKMENGVSGVEDPAFVALQMARNNLKTINPVLCMPQYIIDRLQLKFQLL